MHPLIEFDIAALSRREKLEELTLQREQLRRTSTRVPARTRRHRRRRGDA